jgi:hypothetical protein
MESNGFNMGDARRALPIVAVAMGFALGACTTMGTGTGSTSTGDQPVSFSWQSKDGGVTGTMSATLPGGAAFTGPYLEITNTADTTQFYPMWSGWTPGWSDWGYGGFGGIGQGFTTDYTGKVVANLQGPGSQRMRCNFNLNDPPAGMGGGGQGQCQLAGGATVDAVFPRARSHF